MKKARGEEFYGADIGGCGSGFVGISGLFSQMVRGCTSINCSPCSNLHVKLAAERGERWRWLGWDLLAAVHRSPLTELKKIVGQALSWPPVLRSWAVEEIDDG
nr:hypothetical protein Iba_chr05aCG9820 [Ipomoea batatas]